MRRLFSLVAVLAASASMAHAAPLRTYFSTDPNAHSGLRGWHIDRPSAEHIPHGISLDQDGTVVWDMGVDFEFPDLILANSHAMHGSDEFRLRCDTGQLEIGARVGHPVTQSQVNITGGTEEASLDGLGIGCYGSRSGLYLYQKLPGISQTKLNFYNLFHMGTDSQRNNTPDFFIYNIQTGRMPIVISPLDTVTIGYGTTIGRTFQHTGKTAGFFGAKPVARPVITGSRRDGTALANLIAGLASLGLIDDQSTN
jgi:hypothetical protein